MGWIRDAVGEHLCEEGPDAWLLARGLWRGLPLQVDPMPLEVLEVKVAPVGVEVASGPLLGWDKLNAVLMGTERSNHAVSTELLQSSLCLMQAHDVAYLLYGDINELSPLLPFWTPVLGLHPI